jgi:hypothetical protein
VVILGHDDLVSLPFCSFKDLLSCRVSFDLHKRYPIKFYLWCSAAQEEREDDESLVIHRMCKL